MGLHFDPNIISAEFGIIGSAFLMVDVLKLGKNQIIQSTGEHRLMYPDKNETMDLLTRRLNHIFGAVFLFISYIIQMINSFPELKLFESPYDFWDTISLLLFLIPVTYYVQGKIKKAYLRVS